MLQSTLLRQAATDDMLLVLADHMVTRGRIAFWDIIKCHVPSSTAAKMDEKAARLH